jgi:ribosomal protein L17
MDKLFNHAQKSDLASKRSVAAVINDKTTYLKLYSEIMPNLKGKTSGYTTIQKLAIRRGDGTVAAKISLV